jgi:hypothetical protein
LAGLRAGLLKVLTRRRPPGTESAAPADRLGLITFQRSSECLLVSRGGDQDLRQQRPGGLGGFSLAVPCELAGQVVHNRF